MWSDSYEPGNCGNTRPRGWLSVSSSAGVLRHCEVLAPMRKFVAMIRRHQPGVLAFVDTRLTNAIGEGLNRIVKIIKNRASGFRDLSPFADMIYLSVGDLDIPAQIPKSFRTV